jgi:hypothetical protein
MSAMKSDNLAKFGAVFAIAVGVATFFGVPTAQAVTCDDVRGLSAEQQSYWSKQLHISAYQKHVIWFACYRDYRPDRVKMVQW